MNKSKHEIKSEEHHELEGVGTTATKWLTVLGSVVHSCRSFRSLISINFQVLQ